MADRAVIVEHDGQTVDVHRTCGAESCIKEVMIKLGVPTLAAVQVESGNIDSYVFADDGDGEVVITVENPEKCDYDTWCAWCGDFLAHGLECEHPDKWTELPPLVSGELNPYPGRMNHGDYPGRYTKPE